MTPSPLACPTFLLLTFGNAMRAPYNLFCSAGGRSWPGAAAERAALSLRSDGERRNLDFTREAGDFNSGRKAPRFSALAECRLGDVPRSLWKGA
jgi:hypothetical protein